MEVAANINQLEKYVKAKTEKICVTGELGEELLKIKRINQVAIIPEVDMIPIFAISKIETKLFISIYEMYDIAYMDSDEQNKDDDLNKCVMLHLKESHKR